MRFLRKLCGYIRNLFCPFRTDVILDFVFDAGLLYISIKNIGNRPAYRVSIEFDQPVLGVEGTKEMNSMPLFANLEFLAPAREIRTFLDTSNSFFKHGNPTRITATIEFFDDFGIRHVKQIRHNLEIYKDIGFVHHRN